MEAEFNITEEPVLPEEETSDAMAVVCEAIRREYELRQTLSMSNLERNDEVYQMRKFLKELLNALETRCAKLIRSFRARQADGEALSGDTEAWLKRMEGAHRALDAVLENYGVTVYLPSGPAVQGRDDVQEVIPDTDQAPGTIVKVIRNAYLWRGEILMPAVVCIAE
jgi:molecular chaperone GrpE (heat shock protein)